MESVDLVGSLCLISWCDVGSVYGKLVSGGQFVFSWRNVGQCVLR